MLDGNEPNPLRPFEIRAQEQHATEEKERKKEQLWSFSAGDYGRFGLWVKGRHMYGGVENVFEKLDKLGEYRGYDQMSKNGHQLWYYPQRFVDTTAFTLRNSYGLELRDESQIGIDKVSELLGKELVYAKCIQQLIEANSTSGKPFVVLDVGGGAGLSTIRLARYFEKEILEGKAAFVVSNLGNTIDVWLTKLSETYLDTQQADEERQGNTPRSLSDHEIGLIKKYGHLVHSVRTTVPELFNMTVPLPTINDAAKENLNLRDNVGLLIENHSVSLHDLIPSVHLPILGSILADNGIWFSNTTSLGFVGKKDHHLVREKELERSRQITAQEYDLELVTHIEEGDKRIVGRKLIDYVLRKPKGPKVYGLPSNIGSEALKIRYKNVSS